MQVDNGINYYHLWVIQIDGKAANVLVSLGFGEGLQAILNLSLCTY